MGCVASFFQYGSYDLKEASEQESTEGEGTRRDIPEREYERPYQEPQTDTIANDKGRSEKVSEPEAPIVQSAAVEKQDDTPIVHPIETKEIGLVESEKIISSSQQETADVSKVENVDVPLKDEQNDSSVIHHKEEVPKETQIDVTDSNIHDKLQDENDNANVEVAVVKIQAGIRGYLTRKTLKEQRNNEAAKKSPVHEEKQFVEQDEIHTVEVSEPVQDETHDEEKAAVKIQALYRGYRTRKNLNDSGDELIEETEQGDIHIDDQNSSEKKLESVESEILSDEPHVFEKEAQAAVKIQSTFRGYQVRKQIQEESKKETDLHSSPLESKELSDTSIVGTEGDKDNTEDKAAVKIQAMYRGYKVRKEIHSIGAHEDEPHSKESNKTESIDESRISKDLIEEEEEVEEEEEEEEVEEEEEEEEEEEIQVDDDSSTVKSKASIILSPSVKHDSVKEEKEKAPIAISLKDETIVKPLAPLLDNKVKEHCDEKPLVSESVEQKFPKSVSEPIVELSSASNPVASSLPSPSSD